MISHRFDLWEEDGWVSEGQAGGEGPNVGYQHRNQLEITGFRLESSRNNRIEDLKLMGNNKFHTRNTRQIIRFMVTQLQKETRVNRNPEDIGKNWV